LSLRADGSLPLAKFEMTHFRGGNPAMKFTVKQFAPPRVDPLAELNLTQGVDERENCHPHPLEP
jgi:hypothetical protein